MRAVRGFLVFVGWTVGWFLWALATGIAADVLVILGLKWRPPTGPPVWRSRKPKI